MPAKMTTGQGALAMTIFRAGHMGLELLAWALEQIRDADPSVSDEELEQRLQTCTLTSARVDLGLSEGNAVALVDFLTEIGALRSVQNRAGEPMVIPTGEGMDAGRWWCVERAIWEAMRRGGLNLERDEKSGELLLKAVMPPAVKRKGTK